MERAKHDRHSTAVAQALKGEGWTFTINIDADSADGISSIQVSVTHCD